MPIDLTKFAALPSTTLALSASPKRLTIDSRAGAYSIINTGPSVVYVSSLPDGNPATALSVVGGSSTDVEYFDGPLYAWASGNIGTATITPYALFLGNGKVPASTYGAAKLSVDTYASAPNGYGANNFGQLRQPILYRPANAIYVSNAATNGFGLGNDGTGTGTKAAPYLTIDKALSVTPSAGNYRIICNSGTYSESTGGTNRLRPEYVFTSWVSVESWTGDPNDVTITNAGGSSGVIDQRAGSVGKIQFYGVTLLPTGNVSCIQIEPSNIAQTLNGLHFHTCIFRAIINGSFNVIAVDVSGGSDGPCDDFALINCTFANTGLGANNPLYFRAQPNTIAGNGVFTNFLITGCKTAQGALYNGFAQCYGLNGLQVWNNDFINTQDYAFMVGNDTTTNAIAWTQTNVVVTANRFTNASTAPAGHACLIGFGTQAAIVEDNEIIGAIQGVVVKGATNTVFRGNSISMPYSSGLNGIYAKGAVGTQFLGNTVNVLHGNAFQEDWDGSTVKSSGTVLVGNTLIANGASSVALQWAASTGSLGSGVAANNQYDLRNSATWGNVRGVACSSLANVQAAWVSNGLAGDQSGNDSLSTLAHWDTTLSYTAGANLYARIVDQSGNVFNGFSMEAYSLNYFRSRVFAKATTTATTYAITVPPNLPAGQYTVFWHRQDANLSAASDPVVGQTPLAYSY